MLLIRVRQHARRVAELALLRKATKEVFNMKTNKLTMRILAMVIAVATVLSLVVSAGAADLRFAEDRSRAREGLVYRGDTLYVGETLNAGEYLMSPNRRFVFAVQPNNGNAVKYSTNEVLWHTQSWRVANSDDTRLTLRATGYADLYDILWDGTQMMRRTIGAIGTVAITIQDNGKLVGRDTNGNPVWIDDDVVHVGAGLFPIPCDDCGKIEDSECTCVTTPERPETVEPGTVIPEEDLPPIPFMVGDVNQNGVIDIGDALAILRYLVGLSSEIDNCDISFNAALIESCRRPQIGDALAILRELVGLPGPLSSPRRAVYCTCCERWH